jgi:hypothetical protein
MSFFCICGRRIPTNQAPSRSEGAFVTEAAFDLALDTGVNKAVDNPPIGLSLKEHIAEAIFDAYQDVARSVVFCDVCGRLYLQEFTGSSNYASFLPEQPVAQIEPGIER